MSSLSLSLSPLSIRSIKYQILLFISSLVIDDKTFRKSFFSLFLSLSNSRQLSYFPRSERTNSKNQRVFCVFVTWSRSRNRLLIVKKPSRYRPTRTASMCRCVCLLPYSYNMHHIVIKFVESDYYMLGYAREPHKDGTNESACTAKKKR